MPIQKCARPQCRKKTPSRDTRYCSLECGALHRKAVSEATRPLCGRDGCPNKRQSSRAYCSEECRVAVTEARKTAPDAQRARVEDRIVESVTSYLASHPSHTHRLAVPRPKKTKAAPHEMVLMLSDAHYPEVVDPDVAMGLKYNGDIFRRRLERTRDVVIRYKELRESAYPIQKLTIAMLGDMISGDIHEELAITNEDPVPVALVSLAHYLHDAFLSLAEVFPEVEVVCIPGNHPRTTMKPRFKQKTTTNYEYILGHFIAALAGKSYKVQVPKDMVYVHQVFNWRIGLNHGDGVKSNSFAGIPFYGMRQRRDALQSLLRHLGMPPVDFLLMGHFHQPTVLEGTDCTIILNGAMKGGDEYSLGTRLASQEPVQLLLTIHEKHGLTDTSRINLGDIK
jgi:predicted phosphodiesterase